MVQLTMSRVDLLGGYLSPTLLYRHTPQIGIWRAFVVEQHLGCLSSFPTPSFAFPVFKHRVTITQYPNLWDLISRILLGSSPVPLWYPYLVDCSRQFLILPNLDTPFLFKIFIPNNFSTLGVEVCFLLVNPQQHYLINHPKDPVSPVSSSAQKSNRPSLLWRIQTKYLWTNIKII